MGDWLQYGHVEAGFSTRKEMVSTRMVCVCCVVCGVCMRVCVSVSVCTVKGKYSQLPSLSH